MIVTVLKKIPLLLALYSLQIQAETLPRWKLHDALGLPSWFALSITHRTRYESLQNTFRKATAGSDQVLAFRTLVLAEISYQNWRLGGEFMDSRLALDSPGTPVDTTQVNPAELLQAYLAWAGHNLFGLGLDLSLKAGRQTLDFGSRRLIARNDFRNTINAFTGIDLNLQGPAWQWRSFFVFPVTRLPSAPADLRRSQTQFDEENAATFFTGTFFGLELPLSSRGEIYAYYLHEEDTHHRPIATQNRKLWTPGWRLYRPPKANKVDFEFEMALQTGSSRVSFASRNSLDHLAYFGHAALGYTFHLPWQPRVLVQYDYASGDSNPRDGQNNRFDTLFGARRFEFGPTGIYGAFARANLNSPGFRVEVKPAQGVDGLFAYRAFWLAERRDAWTGANLQDLSGRSGNFLGHQLELRARWQIVPEFLTLEGGFAHLFKGKFARNAPGAPADSDDSNYFYSQTILSF